MARKGSGGGGSQLAQLKTRLHNEGITDRRQMKASAKKRKRGQASSEKDEQEARRQKLNRIASSSQFNPFEEKVTKPKAAVLGQRVRGAVGRPGEARQGGLKERTERLLPEWINRNKSGSFVDRRFGEADGAQSMSVEEKMLERFTRERQKKASKSNMFNLDDMEEEGLTHYGRSLNDLDEYDDIHLSDEETGEDRMAHFGGFGDDDEGDKQEGDDEERTKTKAEVMKEVIAKSKLHKFERQQVKMADEELRQQLDDGFGDLRSLLFAPDAMPSVPENEEADGGQAKEDAVISDKKAKETAYDTAVREMIFERRAKPQDRLKTAEEKAQELAEKLQKAEKDRLRRMRGEAVDGDDADGKGKRRAAGGDDLEDDFELDGMTSADVYGLGQGLGAQPSVDEVDVSDEDDNNAEEEEDEVDEEDEEDDDDEDDDEDDEDSDEDGDNFSDLADGNALADQQGEVDVAKDGDTVQESLVATKAAKAPAKGTKKTTTSALPFTFACPSSMEELLDILASNKVEQSDVPLVIKRIRALHHSSLAEDNKYKLQTLTGVLLDYVLHLSVHVSSSNKDESMQTINELVPQLFTLSKAYPSTSAEHFVGKLALMQRNLTRGLRHGPLDPRAKTWPGLAECTLLKVCATIWPTSDRSHSVTTPLALLIGQYLANCRVRSLSDVAKGLYLVSLTLSNERESKRIVPEALNFLHNVIALLAPLQSAQELARVNRRFGIPSPDLDQPHVKNIRLSQRASTTKPDASIGTASFDLLALLSEDEALDRAAQDAVKMQLLNVSFALLDESAKLYSGSVAFVELFQPFEMLLVDVIRTFDDPSRAWLERAKSETQQRLTRMVMNAQKQRRALRLQAHRAIPLASHVPKFDQGFDPSRKGGRTFDPDAERAGIAKLRALAKKERKGAMRELRRDNEFLAEARRQERQEEDQRYAKTIDKIMGSLSAERGEEKSYLREKQRMKKRAAGGKK